MTAAGEHTRKKTKGRTSRPGGVPGAWKLEDAKARFSEVVRLARSQGPQRVSVRGKDAVGVIRVEALDPLLPPVAAKVPLVDFLEGLHLGGLDLVREPDDGRAIDL